MAVVGVKIAEQIATVVLPKLLEMHNDKNAVRGDVLVLRPTVEKCSVLLQSLPAHALEPCSAEVVALQSALNDAHVLLEALVQQKAEPEPEAEGFVGKIVGGIKKTVASTVETGQEMVRAEGRHKRLTEANERLLHASLDLSVAASKIPAPKSTMCTVM